MGYFLDYELFQTCVQCGRTDCMGHWIEGPYWGNEDMSDETTVDTTLSQAPAPRKNKKQLAQMADAPKGEPINTLGKNLVVRPDMPLAECPCNFDIQSYRGKQLIMQAANPGDIEFDNTRTVHIHVVNWLAFPDNGVDPESGEIREYARVVFFNATGQHFRTTAAHALKRLSAAMELFTPETWERGVHFVITERFSPKTKRTYHDIRLGDETPV